MTLEFIFASPEQTQWEALQQGDVLRRSPELARALSEAHSYYAEAPDYTHFMVLTQSCDLVQREGRPPRSKYITLAAGRPLQVYICRLMESRHFRLDLPIPVYQKRMENPIRQSLERLLHNTEDGFFFLKAGSHPNIDVDICIFLPLSVALRIDHYDTCTSAKIAQLDHVFQAKVGWLTGNIYSRVGTPDLEEKEKRPKEIKDEFFEQAVFAHSAWLTNDQWKILKRTIKKWEQDNTNMKITKDVLENLLTQLPQSVDLVAQRAVETLVASKILPDNLEIKRLAMNILRNDSPFQRLIRNSAL